MKFNKHSLNIRSCKSRVSKRIFFIFVLCAILPLVLLASFTLHHVSSQLISQARERLFQESKARGMDIIERLKFLDSQFTSLVRSLQAKELPAREAMNNDLSSLFEGRFKNLALATMSGRVITAAGGKAPLPILQLKEINHLRRGNTLLVVHPGSTGDKRLFLMKIVSHPGPAEEVLIGEVLREYLWKPREYLSAMTDLVVFDENRDILYSTFSDSVATQAIRNSLKGSYGLKHFAW